MLYSFKAGKDGAYPEAPLTNVSGTLNGTTYIGGSGCVSYGGCGIVFDVSRSGAERVLYRFKGADGRAPVAGLTDVNGKLYGTTLHGGSDADCQDCGTVFDVSTSGKERVLHSFKGLPDDGAYPSAGLINVNGILYGTTASGGSSHCAKSGYGCGTVFRISP